MFPFRRLQTTCILIQYLVLKVTSQPTFFEPPLLNISYKSDLISDDLLSAFFAGSNFYSDRYSTLSIRANYLVRTTNNGQLELFNLTDNSLAYNLFKISNPLNDKMIAYDIPDTLFNRLAVIYGDNNGKVFELLPNQAINAGQPLNYNKTIIREATGVELWIDRTFVLGFNGSYSSIEMNVNGIKVFINTNINTKIFNIKSCNIDSMYYVAIWKRSCVLKLYQCIGMECTEQHSNNSTECSGSQYYTTTARDFYNLEFSKDCKYVLYQDKTLGIKVYDSKMNTQISFRPQSLVDPDSLLDFWFVDYYNNYVGVKNLLTYEIYQMDFANSIFNKVQTKTLPYLGLTAYNQATNSFFISHKNQNLYQYGFYCSSPDFTLTPNGLCQLQIMPDTSPSGTLDTSNQGNDPDNTINSTSDSGPSNTTNHQDQNNQTNPQNTVTLLPSHQPIFEYEATIGQTTSQSFSLIGPSASYAISFFQFFPFAFLFMRFINFWSICTMYLIPGIVFPSYLTDILSKIYTSINTSLFESTALKVSIDTRIQEKFSGEDNGFFGFSSDLLNANVESFATLFFSYGVLFLFYFLSKALPKGSSIKKYLKKIDYKMAVIGQYVSVMNAFYFNLPIITQRSHQNSFAEKVNLICQNFFFFFSTFTACFSFIFLDRAARKKKEREENRKEKLDWFIDCMCNSLVPFVAIIRNVPLFLGVNMVFFMLPVWSAMREKEFRVSKVIQALYIPLLNVTVIGMVAFSKESFPGVYHNLALVVVILVFLGAIHELLSLVFGLVYDMVKFIKSKCGNQIKNVHQLRNQSQLQNKAQKESRAANYKPHFIRQIRRRGQFIQYKNYQTSPESSQIEKLNLSTDANVKDQKFLRVIKIPPKIQNKLLEIIRIRQKMAKSREKIKNRLQITKNYQNGTQEP